MPYLQPGRGRTVSFSLSVGTLHQVERDSVGQTLLIFGQASAEKGQPPAENPEPLERPSAVENGTIVVQPYQGGTTSSPKTPLYCVPV